jgi:hypothetical protein
MNTVTPQMMYSNMSDTNERVKRLEHIMNERLSKLDLLETMAKKLDTFELSISQMRIEIDDIKETQDKHIRIIDKQETHHHNVEGRLRNLENSNRQLEDQNIEIREKLLALQTHSMFSTLVISSSLERKFLITSSVFSSGPWLFLMPSNIRLFFIFSVYQQFPREINDRRKLLVPKLKEFRRQKRKAKMVYDKLIVDGKVYDPSTHREPPRYIRKHYI